MTYFACEKRNKYHHLTAGYLGTHFSKVDQKSQVVRAITATVDNSCLCEAYTGIRKI